MTTLLASSLSLANPATPPAGVWNKPTVAQAMRVADIGSVRSISRSSGSGNQLGVWLDNISYTGNTLLAEFTHLPNATAGGTQSSRVCFANAANDGYLLWLDQAGTTAAIYKFTDYVMDASPIATFTSYGTGYSQTFQLRCVDKANGVFQFWRNGVKVGSDVVDTTHTGLVSIGIATNGGNVSNITTGALFSALTITNPIVSGQPFSGTSIGAVNGAGTISTGGQTVPITFAGGGTTFSGTWPALTDGIVYPTMNGSTLTFTVAQSGSSSTINSVFNPPANFVTTPLGVLVTDDLYLASVYTLQTGWAIYYDATQLGGMVIYPDSRVDVTTPGTFVCWVHELGNGNDLVELTVTVEAADTPPVPGENTRSLRLSLKSSVKRSLKSKL
jgi:hypothetical protein